MTSPVPTPAGMAAGQLGPAGGAAAAMPAGGAATSVAPATPAAQLSNSASSGTWPASGGALVAHGG